MSELLSEPQYTTLTSLFYALFPPFIIIRAYREELTLAGEFGEQWQKYSKRVPAFVPRLKRK
jgi:protein-S-isoprenylcysteine O-methyltransferase Ste14